MLCRYCGQPNADSYKFCEKCGAPLGASQTGPQPAYRQEQTGRSSPVTAALKGMLGSRLALANCILFTLYIFFYIIEAFSFDLGYVYYSLMDYSVSAIETAYTIQIGSLVGIIPMLFIAIGLWITYASAANRQRTTVSTTGLTMIKTIVIIRLVAFCVMTAAFPALIFFSVAAALPSGTLYMYTDMLNAGYLGGLFIIAGIVAAIVIAIFVLGIIYIVKSIKTINTISRTLRKGAPVGNVSSFVAVVNFIFAALFIIVAAAMLALSSACSVIVCLLSAVIYIIFGIFILNYRDKIEIMMPQK